MKYLVVLEGELITVCDSYSEAIGLVYAKANELRECGCQLVDKWIDDFEQYDCTTLYTKFPEFILPIDKETLAKIEN